MVLRGLGAEAVLGPPPTPTTDAGDLQRPRILPRAQVDLIKDTIMAARAVGSAGSPLRIAACLQACLCKQAL